MIPSAVPAACGIMLAAVLAAPAAAATSPAARACPSAGLVNATLGTHLRTAVATHYLTYAKICTYPGGVGLTKITFQQDTAATFAAGEKAAASRLGAKLVKKVTVAPYTALGWYVKDIAQTIQKLNQAGVAMERFEGMKQDKLGAWSPGGGTKVAWFKDPEGHTLSITQL